MPRLVVLLRAINLGPTNKVAMADLRSLLEEEGFTEVRTLLNSGNVVLNSPEPTAKAEVHIARALEQRFGFEIPVMARTAAQIAKVVETAPECHHVVFLSGPPKAAAIKEAEATDLGAERYVLDGRELYLWLADGVQGSRLLKLLGERRLGVRGTMRTWGTVCKLHEVASSK